MKDDNDLSEPKDLQKELADYLSKKYGDRVKVISPVIMQGDKNRYDMNEKEDKTSSLDQVNFNLKPEELKEYLDQYIVKQDEAKTVIATKVCTHFNRLEFNRRRPKSGGGRSVGQIKNNILMIGPTGVGKTYLIKLVAQKLGVSMIKADATKFSETGYVGGDVEDLVRDLYHEAGENKELAEHGIIYIDEIDKIAASRNLIGPDVFLKPMEETEVDIKVAHDPISQMQALERYRRTGKREKKTINTKNILFIMSGAFPELIPIIKKRLQSHGMGFTADVATPEKDVQLLHQIRAEDLIEYGFESEFIGRLPVFAVLDPLTEQDLYQILKNPNNPIITGKKKDFRSYGIDLLFDDEALTRLSHLAAQEKTGARGLVSVIERVLLNFESKLPSTQIRRFSVSLKTVEDPKADLESLLKEPDAPERQSHYERISEVEKQELLAMLQEHEQLFGFCSSMPLTSARVNLLATFVSQEFMDISEAASRLEMVYEQVEACGQRFHDQLGLTVEFTDDAADELVNRVIIEDSDPEWIYRLFCRKFESGLSRVSESTGRTVFTITREAILNPEDYLNNLAPDRFNV
ncbi:MAG: AAA family ATPase [Deltaproteobacteria bacterium]|nr:AAA family ATPase [Deltaproteobacteria bacterium]